MGDSEADLLVSRFRPEQKARVALDLKREDDILRQYIEGGKLDFWFHNLLASAEARLTAAEGPAIESGAGSTNESASSRESKARLVWV